MPAANEVLAGRLRWQAHACAVLGSPFYASLLESAAADVDGTGATAKTLAPEIRGLLALGCQTNEVGRSAALLGGFLEVAHRAGLPLRILEVGASAGLNLNWDRYRYESGKSGEPVEVERIDAATFLERELADARYGMATVVYHSVFMQYVNEDQRMRIKRAIDEASIYYLRMEPAQGTFEIRLGDELLGTSGAHGTGVRWL